MSCHHCEIYAPQASKTKINVKGFRLRAWMLDSIGSVVMWPLGPNNEAIISEGNAGPNNYQPLCATLGSYRCQITLESLACIIITEPWLATIQRNTCKSCIITNTSANDRPSSNVFKMWMPLGTPPKKVIILRAGKPRLWQIQSKPFCTTFDMQSFTDIVQIVCKDISAYQMRKSTHTHTYFVQNRYML